MDFAEEGVCFIGGIHLFIAFGNGLDHSCRFEPVEFHADSVGGVTKFGFESAQVSCGISIEEKLHQQLKPGFRRDQRVQHKIFRFSGNRLNGCFLWIKIVPQNYSFIGLVVYVGDDFLKKNIP